ncbi:hypothetical protein CZP2022_151 [Vibrio phage C-ZP2022]|nr:hypothetical protein CZP2022_151 [Vibrio phage C-ZP2022]
MGLDDFIRRASQKHENKYDYTSVVYKNAKTIGRDHLMDIVK